MARPDRAFLRLILMRSTLRMTVAPRIRKTLRTIAMVTARWCGRPRSVLAYTTKKKDQAIVDRRNAGTGASPDRGCPQPHPREPVLSREGCCRRSYPFGRDGTAKRNARRARQQ